MASKYRKIDPRIWNDARFCALSDDGKLVFLFLLTHPHMTAVGAMRANAYGLAGELGWEHKRFLKAFAEGLSQGAAKALFEYDERASCVVIPNFIKYNAPESPNVIRAWGSAFDLVPECGLKARLHKRLEEYTEGLSEGFRKAFGEAFAKSIANQEQEQEQELNTDNSLRSLSLSGDTAEQPGKDGSRKPKLSKQWVIDHVFAAYAKHLPGLPQPVESRWDSTTTGGKALLARYRESEKHQTPEFWDWFFRAAASNPHWAGNGNGGWKPNGIAWFFTKSKFDDVITRGVDNDRRGVQS